MGYGPGMRTLLIAILLIASLPPRSPAADFDGDGTGDIAVFRPETGLWSIRSLSRLYLGSSGDLPVPGDYDGSGTDRAAVFRKSSGLWSALALTRFYFGGASDEPMPGDYDGDGTEDFGIFRAADGLWAARDVTRAYWGNSDDRALAPGKVRKAPAVFLLRSGQTASYRTGDDGFYQRGRTASYTDNADGTVTDNVTGLMWAKDGNGLGCFGGQTATWEGAIEWAEGLTFAEHSDWRLPNRIELLSLIDLSSRPAFDPAVFPNTKATYYWSSTTHPLNPDIAFQVNFDIGGSSGHSKTVYSHYVRAVRDAPPGPPAGRSAGGAP